MISALKSLSSKFSTKSISIEHLFQSRRLLYQSTSQQLSNNMFFQKYHSYAAYCGYDPTAESLHLGNLVSIVMMARLHLQGIRPIFLIGGATGLIGDPSGKIKERILLEQNVVNHNITALIQQISNVYSNILSLCKNNHQLFEITKEEVENLNQQSFTIKNNYQFYKDFNAINFLRDVGKHFRMGTLLNKEVVANRVKSEDGISYAEFSYSIIQAYDFYKLFAEEKCILQFGGSDQWGNITNGCQLIRKKQNQEAFGITMPLLLTKNGQKFGKSQGNALFLSSTKTPLSEIHQYLLNTADDEVQNLLHIFTFYSNSKILEIIAEHNKNKEKRQAQIILAESVIKLLSKNTESIVSKNNEYFTLTNQEIKVKDQAFFEKLFHSLQAQKDKYFKIDKKYLYGVKQNDNNENITFLADFFVKFQLAKTKKQVRRQIQAGGLYLNNKKLQKNDIDKEIHTLLQQNVLYQKYLLVRWGKKRYQFIQFL